MRGSQCHPSWPSLRGYNGISGCLWSDWGCTRSRLCGLDEISSLLLPAFRVMCVSRQESPDMDMGALPIAMVGSAGRSVWTDVADAL